MIENILKANMQAVRAMIAGVAVSVLALVVSLFTIGPNAGFAMGIAAGFLSGSVCVFLISAFVSLMATRRKSAFALVGFLLRVMLFSVVFYSALNLGGYEAAAGCAIAFVAPYAGASCAPHLERLHEKLTAKGNAPQARKAYAYEYEDSPYSTQEIQTFLLVRSFDTVCYKNGRRYITHRMFRRLASANALPPENRRTTGSA